MCCHCHLAEAHLLEKLELDCFLSSGLAEEGLVEGRT